MATPAEPGGALSKDVGSLAEAHETPNQPSNFGGALDDVMVADWWTHRSLVVVVVVVVMADYLVRTRDQRSTCELRARPPLQTGARA